MRSGGLPYKAGMDELIESIRKFAKERDWEKFHSPKNLAMALSVEASEILEHFQWLTQEESRNLSPEKLAEVKDEIGDVLVYLLNLADKLGVDPIKAASDKMVKNAGKYPISAVHGRVVKHTQIKPETER